MRTCFLDSSALVKNYALEDGSKRVQNLFKSATLEQPTVVLVVCDIALTEIESALARKERENEITGAEADRYIERVRDHFTADSRPYLIIPASSVYADAGQYSRTYGLKSADSIQLAAALTARYNAPPDTTFKFVGTDGDLCDAARAENFTIMDVPRSIPAGEP